MKAAQKQTGRIPKDAPGARKYWFY